MLSEDVLADLTRRCPTQSWLIVSAWTSLSTESRLQVITAVQRNSDNNTPDWLVDLALKDGAEIVRYWATRSADFREEILDLKEPFEIDQGFKKRPAPPEDIERASLARADTSELVRLSADKPRLLYEENLAEMPQKNRLIAIRNERSPSLTFFVTCLARAIERDIPDDELSECAAEFFAHSEVVEQMKEDDLEDGLTAHYEGKAVTEGWALLRGKAGPRLMMKLVYALPVDRGLGVMTAEDLSSMPEPVLGQLLHRNDHKVFFELADLIRKQPERFPLEIIKTLRHMDDGYSNLPSVDERTEHARRHAVDRHAAALDTVLEIRREVVRLHERLNEVEEAVSKKRGIFG